MHFGAVFVRQVRGKNQEAHTEHTNRTNEKITYFVDTSNVHKFIFVHSKLISATRPRHFQRLCTRNLQSICRNMHARRTFIDLRFVCTLLEMEWCNLHCALIIKMCNNSNAHRHKPLRNHLHIFANNHSEWAWHEKWIAYWQYHSIQSINDIFISACYQS